MPTRLLVAGLAIGWAHACAQQNPPVVTIKATADTLRRDDTAARTVVNHEQILQYGDISALDVLKRLPGVTVDNGAPRLRGLGAGYTQVLLDGQRMPAGFPLDSLAPETIEKIEILRAGLAEYGAGAIAGTINIVLRKGKGKRSRTGKAMLQASTEIAGARADAEATGRMDDAAYTLNAVLNRYTSEGDIHASNALLAPDGRPQSLRHDEVNSRVRATSLNLHGRLDWTPGAGQKASWQTFAALTRFHADRGTVPQTLLGQASPFAHEDYWRRSDILVLRSNAEASHTWEDGASLSATLSAQAERTPNTRLSGADGHLGEALLRQRYDTRQTAGNIATRGKLTLARHGAHQWSAGWDLSSGKRREWEAQEQAPLAFAAPIDFERTTQATVANRAWYLQDEWEAMPALSLYAGLRHESSTLRTHGTDLPPGATRTQVTSPILQALWIWQHAPRRQLRLALVRNYKAPTPGQLLPRRFLSLVNTPTSPDASGMPGLRPEIAQGLDVTFEMYGADGALFSLMAGSRRIEDVILHRTRLEGARWVSTPLNSGPARTRSLELEWKQGLGALPLKLSLSAARHWSSVAALPGPDNRLARQPPWTLNAGADYGSETWKAGMSFQASASGMARVSQRQSVRYGGRRMLDAHMSYRASAVSQWRLAASNLLVSPQLERTIFLNADNYIDERESTHAGTVFRLSYERKY